MWAGKRTCSQAISWLSRRTTFRSTPSGRDFKRSQDFRTSQWGQWTIPGREAAVVFFSMATSSGDDMTRGVEFLFSRNRLNVAVSRARCLAYLVCTNALLDTRARTVEDMRLISTLNAFVDTAARQTEAAEAYPHQEA